MLKEFIQLRSQKGSLMVEAIAMLGLISMVTPIIYKKAAERTNEVQDINAANEVRTIVNSIDAYLKDNYSTITGGGKVSSLSASSNKEVDYGAFGFNSPNTDTSTKSTTPINIEHFRDYLPLGFRAKGKMFDDFKVVIKQTKDLTGARKALTSVLVAEPTSAAPNFSRLRTARIASMIGTNGGYIDGDKATGVQGVWEIPKSEILSGESAGSLKDGTIVATSIEPVAEGGGGSPKDVLYRVEVPNHPEYNVMETTLSMGGKPIDQIVDLIAAGEDKTINIKAEGDTDDTGSNATLKVAGKSIINDTLTAAGENFVVESGYVQHKQNLYIGGGKAGADAPFSVTGANGAIRGLGGKFNVSLEGDLPYIKLSGKSDALTVMNANENKVSFMNQNVSISPDGDTDIAGYAHVKGTFSAANQNFTVDADGNTAIAGRIDVDGSASIEGNLSAAGGNFTSNATYSQFSDETLSVSANSRLVEIGKEGKTANLRVYGDTTLDNLNVEDTFQAGASNGKYSLTTDPKGTTIRLNDENSVFSLQDNNDMPQIFAIPGITALYGNGSQILFAGDIPDGTKSNAQAMFYSDIAVQDSTSTNKNILTISPMNEDGTNIAYGRGSVHIRKGVIELDRNTDAEANKSNPISYIKADRFVSNVQPEETITIDGTNNTYNTFQVNPAYTSMMNDIKLASRGGARLSDILPDFINKGIYVLDNTFKGSANWDEENANIDSSTHILSGLSSCNGASDCDTSPWLGFIPTPNCPPGYLKVATITPIRFAMAQAGIPLSKSGIITAGSKLVPDTIGQHTDPRLSHIYTKQAGENEGNAVLQTGSFSLIKAQDTTIIDGSNTGNDNMQYTEASKDTGNLGKWQTPDYWVTNLNEPYTFQINTWLSTSLKAHRKDSNGNFKGWHGIMGFIYPAKDYANYAEAAGKMSSTDASGTLNDKVIWNLFPVHEGELSAIATIYCYFDREDGRFSDNYVDRYLPHNVSLDKIRDQTKPSDGSSPNYDDPNLNYNAPW